MSLERALSQSVKKSLHKSKHCVSKEKPTEETAPHLRLGRQGEDIAAEYLTSCGYEVLARNVSYKWGEIDLVCQYDDEIIFVEVRTRSVGMLLPPEMTVGPNKLQKLTKSARTWAESRNYTGFWRIDLLAITFSNDNSSKIEHIKNITEGIW